MSILTPHNQNIIKLSMITFAKHYNLKKILFFEENFVNGILNFVLTRQNFIVVSPCTVTVQKKCKNASKCSNGSIAEKACKFLQRTKRSPN